MCIRCGCTWLPIAVEACERLPVICTKIQEGSTTAAYRVINGRQRHLRLGSHRPRMCVREEKRVHTRICAGNMAHVFARVIVRGAAPLSLAARPRVAVLATAPRRLKSTAPSTIYDDSHLFPDQVLEEDKTGFPVGLPQIKEAELWKEGAEGTLVRRAAPDPGWLSALAERRSAAPRRASNPANIPPPCCPSSPLAARRARGALVGRRHRRTRVVRRSR